MSEFILYGTAGCHLCEEAQLLLQTTGLDFVERDLIDDPAAMALYAVRIPVLRHQASGAELNWPFDEIALQHFLALR